MPAWPLTCECAAALGQGWKTDVVVDVLRAAYPHLRWEEVAAALDYDGFVVPDESANMLLLSTWQRAAGAAFPVEALCGRLWSNTLGQLSFLKHAVGVPPHLLRWDIGPRKLVRAALCCAWRACPCALQLLERQPAPCTCLARATAGMCRAS